MWDFFSVLWWKKPIDTSSQIADNKWNKRGQAEPRGLFCSVHTQALVWPEILVVLLGWDCEEQRTRASSAEGWGPSVWEQRVPWIKLCRRWQPRGGLSMADCRAPTQPLPLLHGTQNEVEKLMSEGKEITY